MFSVYILLSSSDSPLDKAFKLLCRPILFVWPGNVLSIAFASVTIISTYCSNCNYVFCAADAQNVSARNVVHRMIWFWFPINR